MSEILLPIPPHGYDNNAPAGLIYENNVPKLLFDDTTPEGVFYQFRMPGDYGSALAIKLVYAMTSATSGNIEFEVAIWAITEGEDILTPSYDAVNAGSEAVPGTAGLSAEISITLTNADSLAAGDLVRLSIARDADDATNDTAAGDLELLAASLVYTAA